MSSALATALKEEIKHEEGGYEKPDAIAGGPPAPFKLSEAPGDTMLTLTRSFDGGETVRVDLHVNNQVRDGQDDGSFPLICISDLLIPMYQQCLQPAVEPTEDGEALSTVVFNVTVTKGDQSLVFECESDGTWTSINHISQEPKDADPLPDSFYTVRSRHCCCGCHVGGQVHMLMAVIPPRLEMCQDLIACTYSA
jgi:hypothetical protein